MAIRNQLMAGVLTLAIAWGLYGRKKLNVTTRQIETLPGWLRATGERARMKEGIKRGMTKVEQMEKGISKV